LNRATYYFLWLIVIRSTSPIGAQVPTTTTTQPVVTAIPKTPAGEALRAWLDAFNSGDSALLGAYQRRFEPDLTVSDHHPRHRHGPASGHRHLAHRDFAQPLLYSSWRRHHIPVSLRPLGARSSHWYIPQRPSSPRA